MRTLLSFLLCLVTLSSIAKSNNYYNDTGDIESNRIFKLISLQHKHDIHYEKFDLYELDNYRNEESRLYVKRLMWIFAKNQNEFAHGVDVHFHIQNSRFFSVIATDLNFHGMTFTNCKIENVSTNYGDIDYYCFTTDSINSLSVVGKKMTDFRSEKSFYKNISFESYSTIEDSVHMDFENNVVEGKFYVLNSYLTYAVLDGSTLGQLQFSKIILRDSLTLKNCIISRSSFITGKFNGTLNLSDLAFEKDGELDIRYCIPEKKLIPLNLHNVPIDRLRLDWKNFTMDTALLSNYPEMITIYSSLLENFKKHNQIESVELIDKEFQRYKYNHFKFPKLGWLWDKIVWLWWDYGYGGWQVVLWMLLLPFVWAIIAFAFFDRLHNEVYKLENYEPRKMSNKKPGGRKTFWRSLLYVSVIFFTLNIKFDKLYYHKRGLLLLFFLIYLNGIFCLFFLVNFLLKA